MTDAKLNRLQALHRGQPLVKEIPIKSIYRSRRSLSIGHIPFRVPNEHTMFEALDLYVEQKLPIKEIFEVAKNNGSLEVHGIYPNHFDLVFGENGQSSGTDWTEIDFYHKPTTRKYNSVRPRFFHSTNYSRFISCVAPGSDYIQHYGTMIRHLCRRNQIEIEPKLYYYPIAFETLPDWTQLDRGFIWPQDCVVIGYAEEIHRLVIKAIDVTPLSSASNPYFESRRYRLPSGTALNILGVNFSFWGNLSQILGQGICQNQPEEIIYVGKLGSMTHPDSLYKDAFVPSMYSTLHHANVVDTVTDVENGLLQAFPELDTGLHVSVPTVLEEDFLQRAVASDLGARSIDNEISQLARSISDHNQSSNAKIRFSAFHFATDYVRTAAESALETAHDLSNNRADDAMAKKEFILRHLSSHLIRYLEKR